MTARLAAVSIDLDEALEYFRIHALQLPSSESASAHAVYDVALDRIADFGRDLGLPLTLFAIGKDVLRPQNAARLRRFVAEGHAIENHSRSHRYDLTRLDHEVIAAEIEGGRRAIAAAVGVAPTGFRAPGYTVTNTLFDVLEDLGVAFDSSVFPSAPYHAAKAIVRAWLGIRGRSSASILGGPGVLRAPITPYRPGVPYSSRGRRSFVELPIQVIPIIGWPVIGTSIALAGAAGVAAMVAAIRALPFVNLELHGMDFLRAEDDLHALRGAQPELRVALDVRLGRLRACVEGLRAAGFTFVRLDEAAAHFARQIPRS